MMLTHLVKDRGTTSRLAVIAILMMLTAACGGGLDGTDVAAVPTDDSAPTSTAAATSSSELPTSMAEFWGYGEDFDPAEEEAKYREQEMQVQQLVAECMAAEGFQYTPYVPEESYAFYDDGRADLTEEERMAQYGYGVFTYMLEETQAFEEDEYIDDYDPTSDPNWVYQESLSESERTAYELTLWGDWSSFEEPEPTFDEDGNEIWPEPDWSEIGGCQNTAQEEIWGGFGPDPEMEALWEELGPKQEELYDRIQTDTRIVEANQEWSACMAGAGYTYTNQEEIHEYLWSLQEEMWEDDESFWLNIEAQAEQLPEDEREAFYEDAYADIGPWGPNVTAEQVQAWADEELAIAAADWDCRGDMTELIQEVTEEYEAQFITENIELLQKVKDAQETLGY